MSLFDSGEKEELNTLIMAVSVLYPNAPYRLQVRCLSALHGKNFSASPDGQLLHQCFTGLELLGPFSEV